MCATLAYVYTYVFTCATVFCMQANKKFKHSRLCRTRERERETGSAAGREGGPERGRESAGGMEGGRGEERERERAREREREGVCVCVCMCVGVSRRASECVCGLCVCAHMRVRAQTVVCKIWKLGIFQDCHRMPQ